MPYYNPDGSINGSPADGSGVYTKSGGVAVTIPTTTLDLSGYVKQTDIQNNMASTAPPPVSVAGQAGTAAQFARSDHTHLSSVIKVIKVTTDTTGIVNWSYPVGFFTDVPVICLTVEVNSGQPMTALLTSNTATGGSTQILKAQPIPQNLVSLLVGSVYNIFGATVPVGTRLHVFAGKATS